MRTFLLLILALTLHSCKSRWGKFAYEKGGRLSSIVAEPTDPSTLMVSSPGGGVFITNDNGASWKRIVISNPIVNHLEWDADGSGKVYAVTPSALYRLDSYTGSNLHFVKCAGFSNTIPPLYPHNPRVESPKPFYQKVLTTGQRLILYSRRGEGLFYSYDGVNFTQSLINSNSPSSPDNYILAIGMDANNYVYLSTMTSSSQQYPNVYKSNTPWAFGSVPSSWTLQNTGLPTSDVVQFMDAGGKLSCLANLYSGGSRLYEYSSSNSQWQAKGAFPAASWAPSALLQIDGNHYAAGTVVAYESQNGGTTWNEISKTNGTSTLQVHPDYRGIYSKSYPIAGKHYVWMTTDGTGLSGTTTVTYHNIVRWEKLSGQALSNITALPVNGILAWQPHATYSLVHANGDTRSFTGSLDNTGLCYDTGNPWTTDGSVRGTSGDVWSIVAAPSDPNRLYARGNASETFGRCSNAKSAATCADVVWDVVTPQDMVYAGNLSLNSMTAVHPTNPDKVIFAGLYNVGISSDGGNTINKQRLPANERPVCAYANDTAYYVGTLAKGILFTSDNGASWSSFGLSSAGTPILDICFSSVNGGTWFAGTTDGLYMKTGSGAWVKATLPQNLSTIITDVEVDPDCNNRILFGVGYASYFGKDVGKVCYSEDGGSTWKIYESFGGYPVTDLQIISHSTRKYITIATHGGGTHWRPLPLGSCP